MGVIYTPEEMSAVKAEEPAAPEAQPQQRELGRHRLVREYLAAIGGEACRSPESRQEASKTGAKTRGRNTVLRNSH